MLNSLETDEGWLAVAIIRDLTDRNRAEEQLRESEESFRILVEGVKDYAVFRLDPNGQVASWNAGAERIKGYRAEEIIGQRFTCFYTPEDVERGKPEDQLKLAYAQGRAEDEGWRVRKGGSRFALVIRDFTDRKRAEEALLLEITTVLVSKLDIRELLAAASASLSRVKPHDYASLALQEPETKQLRVLPATTRMRKIRFMRAPSCRSKARLQGWHLPLANPCC